MKGHVMAKGFHRLSKTREEKLVEGGRRREQIRLMALKAYSGGNPRCMCECGCSETRIVYLDLDHINGGAQKHYKSLGLDPKWRCGRSTGGGSNFLKILKNLRWPNDPPLRVLCIKCNCGRARNGGQCPELGVLSYKEKRRRRKMEKEFHDGKIIVAEQPSLFDGILEVDTLS